MNFQASFSRWAVSEYNPESRRMSSSWIAPLGYEPIRQLSDDGQSQVWQVVRGQVVSVMRLGPTSTEMGLLAALDHPGLLKLQDHGVLPDGRVWYVRAWSEGREYGQWAADKPRTVAEVARVACEVGEALSYLHAQGLLHGDLSPRNILVTPDGGAQLADYGLTHRMGAPAQGASGTPFHIAPEILLQTEVGPASDVFALGSVLARGWAADEVDPRTFHARFPQEDYFQARGARRAGLPADVADLVESMLERDPRRRLGDARMVVRAFAERGGTRRTDLTRKDQTRRGLRLELRAVRKQFIETELPRLSALSEGQEGPGFAAWRVDDASESLPLARAAALASSLAARVFHVVEATDAANLSGDALALYLEQALVRSNTGVLCVVDGESEAAALMATRLLIEAARAGRAALFVGARTPSGARAVVDVPAVRAEDLQESLRDALDADANAITTYAAWLVEACAGSAVRLAWALEESRRLGVLQEGLERPRLRPGTWPRPQAAAQQLSGEGLDGRALLAVACLVAAGRALEDRELAGLLQLSGDAVEALLVDLRRLGAIRPVDEGWETHAQLSGDVWFAPLRMAHQRLAAKDADPVRQRLHKALSGDLEAREACVAHSVQLREAGRSEASLDALRELQQGLQRCGFGAAPEVCDAMSAAHAAMGRALECQQAVLPLSGDAPRVVGVQLAARARSAALRHEDAEAVDVWRQAAAVDPRYSSDALFAEAVQAHATRADAALEACVARIEEDRQAPERHVANARSLLAMARLRRGDVQRAKADLDALFARAEERGEPLRMAAALTNLATLRRRSGDERSAAEALERAARCYEGQNHLAGQAQVLTLLAGTLRECGEPARACEMAGHAVLLRERLGDDAGAVTSRSVEALTWIETGVVRRALQGLSRSLDDLRTAGRSADAALLAGRLEEQLARVGRELSAAERQSHKTESTTMDADPRALLARGRAAWMRADVERAEELLARSADLAGKLRQGGVQAQALATQELLRAHEQRRRPVSDKLDNSEDSRVHLLLTAERFDPNAVRDMAEDLLRRGRNDRAARLYAALAARGDAPRSKEDRTLALDLVRSCCSGLSEAESAELLRRLLGSPDPVPEDLRALERVEVRGEESELKQLLAINRRLVAQEDLPALLAAIVESALEVTGAERGFLILAEDGRFIFDTARDSKQGEIQSPEHEVSTSILRETLRMGTILRLSNAGQDPTLGSSPSIVALELRSILCAPFLVDARTSGVIYLDHRVRTGAFGDRAEYLLGLLSDQAALAIRQVKRLSELRETTRRLQLQVQNTEQDLRSTETMLAELRQVQPTHGLVGRSAVIRDVQRLIERAAPATLPVLIVGESGTGKELAARAIHARSLRAGGPFVRESLASIPLALVEAELFGWKRGAFTGADNDRAGLIESSNGGTLFLDEIGELPLDVQAKLLRVLETGEIRRLGETRGRSVSLRLVTATNRDLEHEVRVGRFRADLYYRLDGLRIRMPGLAERPEDVPMLVEHFLRMETSRLSRTWTLTPEVMAALVRRAWPGNVRELRNEVARLCALSDGSINDPQLVRPPQELTARKLEPEGVPLTTLAEIERLAIAKALSACSGDKGRAADILGISRAKIYQRLKEWREAGVPLPEDAG